MDRKRRMTFSFINSQERLKFTHIRDFLQFKEIGKAEIIGAKFSNTKFQIYILLEKWRKNSLLAEKNFWHKNIALQLIFSGYLLF